MAISVAHGLSGIIKASVLALALQAGFSQAAMASEKTSPLLGMDASLPPGTALSKNQIKPKVGVGIIIAIDVSGSSEAADYGKMLHLYEKAFRSEQVHSAIEAAGGVAVSVVQFANRPALANDWVIIKGPHDLKDPAVTRGLSFEQREKLVQQNRAAIRRQAFALAEAVSSMPRVPQQLIGSSTFLSHAVEGAEKLVKNMPFEADDIFMDLNCDGPDGYRNALQTIVKRAAARTGLKVHGNDFARGIERTAVGENDGDYRDFFEYLVRNLIPSAEAGELKDRKGMSVPMPAGTVHSFENERDGNAMPGILAYKIYPAAG